MSKYIDADQIRAEIARINLYSQSETLAQILHFIDSLPEQSVIKKSNALFDKCVENCDPAVMKEVSDNIDRMLGKQPVEGLEDEIKRYLREEHDRDTTVRDVARHFAEWQKAKMLEGAVEGKVFMSFAPGHNQMVMADVDLPVNTKVKVIIVKEDGK